MTHQIKMENGKNLFVEDYGSGEPVIFELTATEDAGHAIFIEKRDEVNQFILDSLKK